MRVLVPVFALGLAAVSAAGAASIGLIRERDAIAEPAQPDVAGVVSGRVEDAAGAALASVKVELTRDQAVVQTTRTNPQGMFRFEKVAPGTYTVVATREGLMPDSVRVAVTTLATPALRLALGIPNPATATLDMVQQRSIGSGRGGAGGGIVAGVPLPSSALGSQPTAREGLMFQRADQIGVPFNPGFNTEAYDKIDENSFRRVADEAVSTFSIDIDTASYANVRRFLNDGTLPPADAVRIEELINYFRFPYRDAPADVPFSVTTEVAACPWNPRHSLALVGLQARRDDRRTPPRNLVFLLDVSGSMMPPDKLPLVKTAMRMLVDTLTSEDRVAVVVYAGASGLALPLTSGDRKAEIHRAIEMLAAGGSTNGASGIQLAYDIAASGFVKGGVNRVILATDGDFNVGVTSQGELIRLIEQERERGIFLSVLGVGTDNLKDSTMEKLADRGNGNYAYLDSLLEARRVLIEEANSTLVTVAKDVKIQIEFNPRTVAAYRLIGYENRLLNRQDFNDDKKDAGEIGAGHTVTALYELIPPGEAVPGATVDPLVYQDAPRPVVSSQRSNELMTVKLRYKKPDEDTSRLLTMAVDKRAGEMSPNIGFAAAVAEFGMLLRRSANKGDAGWASAQTLARTYRGEDPGGHRAEFIRLLDLAAALDAQTATTPPPAGDRR
jgi:Ca-activated chloride channel family protein